jgi:hypothetical protein
MKRVLTQRFPASFSVDHTLKTTSLNCYKKYTQEYRASNKITFFHTWNCPEKFFQLSTILPTSNIKQSLEIFLVTMAREKGVTGIQR